MSSLPARGVMQQVAKAMPEERRREIIIVGSLAAAYHFFGRDPRHEITTKDVDGMLSPNAVAVRSGRIIAERLFATGWTLRRDPEWGEPGDSSKPADELPILRLNPPGNTDWYLELAAAPAEGDTDAKTFERVTTKQGDFALHSFRFLALAEEDPLETGFGMRYARPEMMALANLLHHPRVAPELIKGTTDKRSNKDLGRVLSLAWLSMDEDSESLDAWHPRWLSALRKRFPGEWRKLALRAGDGLRQLLDENHKLDLDQASRIANLSLLRGRDLGPENLRATGRRVLVEALGPLEAAARSLRR
jgi:hypothetical protein